MGKKHGTTGGVRRALLTERTNPGENGATSVDTSIFRVIARSWGREGNFRFPVLVIDVTPGRFIATFRHQLRLLVHTRLTSLFYRGKQRGEGYRTERLAPCHNYCHYVRAARKREGNGPPANVFGYEGKDVFGTSGRMFAWTRHVTWEFTMMGEIEVARRIWSTDSLGNALCDIPSTFVTAFVKFCFVILSIVDGNRERGFHPMRNLLPMLS